MAANSATTVVAMTTTQRDLFGDVDDDGILSLVGLACFVITPVHWWTLGYKAEDKRSRGALRLLQLHCCTVVLCSFYDAVR